MAKDTSKQRRGFSPPEMIAVCAVVACASAFAMYEVMAKRLQPHLFFSQPALAELSPLEKYGPGHFSRDFEEWIVRDYFEDRREGVFLDVGANHHQVKNNTYFLEMSLGWSGVAVDALEEFAPGYKAYRPRTRFVAMFASDVADSKVQFFVPENNLVASANPDFTSRYGATGKA
ncbi:MAG: hypothetical protein H0W08_24680, partial [Acidobacteria bacterium]|nr:hypothetical protein [Acidobacteriota bacterium]